MHAALSHASGICLQDSVGALAVDSAVLQVIIKRPNVLSSTSKRIGRSLAALVHSGICPDTTSAARLCFREPMLLAINAQALRRKALLLRLYGFTSVPPACFARGLERMAERIAFIKHAR